MTIGSLIEQAGKAADIAGVAMIVGGLLFATARLARPLPSDGKGRYARYRHDLGRAILLGLELLVAADIIRTVALTPTLESLGVLAMIVAIRTFLSLSLSLELDGRWPWQRSRAPAGTTA